MLYTIRQNLLWNNGCSKLAYILILSDASALLFISLGFKFNSVNNQMCNEMHFVNSFNAVE